MHNNTCLAKRTNFAINNCKITHFAVNICIWTHVRQQGLYSHLIYVKIIFSSNFNSAIINWKFRCCRRTCVIMQLQMCCVCCQCFELTIYSLCPVLVTGLIWHSPPRPFFSGKMSKLIGIFICSIFVHHLFVCRLHPCFPFHLCFLRN